MIKPDAHETADQTAQIGERLVQFLTRWQPLVNRLALSVDRLEISYTGQAVDEPLTVELFVRHRNRSIYFKFYQSGASYFATDVVDGHLACQEGDMDLSDDGLAKTVRWLNGTAQDTPNA